MTVHQVMSFFFWQDHFCSNENTNFTSCVVIQGDMFTVLKFINFFPFTFHSSTKSALEIVSVTAESSYFVISSS